MNPDNNSIAVVAARIQERAFQLSSEQAKLKEVKSELEEVKEVYSNALEENFSMRREMLEILNTRNEMELNNVMKLKDEIILYETKVEEIARKCDEDKQRLEYIQNKLEDSEKTVYAKHEADQELFKRNVEGRLDRRQKRKKKRQDYLNFLAKTSLEADESAATLHNKIQKTRKKISSIDFYEDREDEEIASIAMNIRATLSKVSTKRTY